MAIPRRELVDDSCSSIYHCISRTVRQAFLLAPRVGDEREGREDTGTSADLAGPIDDHRRDWVVDRLHLLSQVFAIDCVSLAVMSNHLHLLLRTLPELVDGWSSLEIAYRWLLLRPPRARRLAMGLDPESPPLPAEIELLAGDADRIATLRGRLGNLSWYMKELKEWVARRANREEGRTGAFWEERFRSFRVLDDSGVLRCATYIDLNPVAAGMAVEPLLAKYTSIAEHARSDVVGTDASTGRLIRKAEASSPKFGTEGGPRAECASPTDAQSTDWRLAVRSLWQAVMRGADDCDPTKDIDASVDQASSLGSSMDDFIASFEGIVFHPAIPARREPHHARGAAERDPAEGDEAIAAGEVEFAAPPSLDGEPAPQEPVVTTPPAPDLPARAPRHRRQAPSPLVHPIHLDDYLQRLRRLAELAQEPGHARGRRRSRLRSRLEIEAALGRRADDRGVATLIAELFGSDRGASAAEVAGLLSSLLGGARHFGTAIGSRTALAAEAIRRGRTRIVSALRTEPPRRWRPTTATRGDPAVPRAE